jgi:hypothetical protein
MIEIIPLNVTESVMHILALHILDLVPVAIADI